MSPVAQFELVLFLPPLLVASAYFTVWRDFRRNLWGILNLAIGAVAFTTLPVGLAAHWAACFAASVVMG